MKIRATQTFQYEDEKLEEGEVYNLPDSAAEDAVEKGYAEKVEDESSPPKIEEGDSDSSGEDQGGSGGPEGLDVSEAKKGEGVTYPPTMSVRATKS